ncbi:hypothetical protein BKA56DRAFT_676928 [Ilyonectria sp. MPI-CAGE-AT-0026]|nr:hypothetical protein BKA56DRAFT_676928 [Ilyonectria sp. MPI-CAGE-AT-0026]
MPRKGPRVSSLQPAIRGGGRVPSRGRAPSGRQGQRIASETMAVVVSEAPTPEPKPKLVPGTKEFLAEKLEKKVELAAHFAKQRDHFGKLADKALNEIVDLQEEIAAAPAMADGKAEILSLAKELAEKRAKEKEAATTTPVE